MGQQQLLLLVLGIVIVGLAVVVGIQAFGENQKKANADALVNDAIRIASDAQAWKLKPAAFGGGAAATNWTGLTFEQLGYETGDKDGGDTAGADDYENLNGVFVMSGQSTADLVITGTNSSNGNQVQVTVSGTSSDQIQTTVSNTGS